MTFIIDRRLNGKNKSAVNRQRFLDRYRSHIKKAVSNAVNKRSIVDIDKGEKVTIPTRDIDEPSFRHAPGGEQEAVLPGNKEFAQGDQIPRPRGGAGGGSGSGAGQGGDGEDDFSFSLSKEEFLDFMFEGLELPNLVKRQLAGNDSFKLRRAGISNEGTPNRLNVVRSLRSAQARRIALTGKKRRRLRDIERRLSELADTPEALRDGRELDELENERLGLRRLIDRIPYLDDFDLKYNLLVKQPQPSSKAVMFCIMDVSGSMNQAMKDMAKRFFILLYLFLQRSYDKTEIVFIRHHTSAKEVDEEEFFYSRETGGTIVSSALKKMNEIIRERYPASEWNIYGAQASDGDNWNDDSSVCYDWLTEHIVPQCQYYAYIEITDREHQQLWYEYEAVREAFPEHFAMQQIISEQDIYPVFRELFHKRVHA